MLCLLLVVGSASYATVLVDESCAILRSLDVALTGDFARNLLAYLGHRATKHA